MNEKTVMESLDDHIGHRLMGWEFTVQAATANSAWEPKTLILNFDNGSVKVVHELPDEPGAPCNFTLEVK